MENPLYPNLVGDLPENPSPEQVLTYRLKLHEMRAAAYAMIEAKIDARVLLNKDVGLDDLQSSQLRETIRQQVRKEQTWLIHRIEVLEAWVQKHTARSARV